MMQTESFSNRLLCASQHAALRASAPRRQDIRDEIRLNAEIQDQEPFLTAFGNALAKTPLFSNGFLTLYCGVPVKYLLPGDHAELVEYLDFVVCWNQAAIVAIKVARPEMDLPTSEQLLQEFQKTTLPSSLQLFILDSSAFADLNGAVQNVESLITQFLQPNGPSIKTSFRPIPSDLLKNLSEPRVQALTLKKTGRRKSWFPTEYGRSLGILQRFQADKTSRVHALLCCAEETLAALRLAAAWGERENLPPPQETLPFSQRVSLANRGLPSNAAAVVELVRAFAETPLEEYLKDAPEDLAEFQRRFPNARTYQQAAACVDQSGDFSLSDALVKPLYRKSDISIANRPMRSVLLAASFLAKSKYLTWQGDLFLHDYDSNNIAGRWTYKQWLQWAIRKQTEGSRDPGLSFLVHFLAIKPFALINRQSILNCA